MFTGTSRMRAGWDPEWLEIALVRRCAAPYDARWLTAFTFPSRGRECELVFGMHMTYMLCVRMPTHLLHPTHLVSDGLRAGGHRTPQPRRRRHLPAPPGPPKHRIGRR
ncbi:hypothetical protein GCM10010307_26480 [Streptomyces vastus]|uniref:Uncharacterized protein n=1 Tax=Streptomyces vastus TaxID=285451 RepID=A0ABN3QQX1_9ACTN